MPGKIRDQQNSRANSVVTPPLPCRLMYQPVAICANRAPTAIQPSAMPSVPSLKGSAWRTSGMRAI